MRRGRTWVWWANVLLLQWLGVRLYRHIVDGSTVSYGLMSWTLPLSGWRGSYVPQPRHYRDIWRCNPPGARRSCRDHLASS